MKIGKLCIITCMNFFFIAISCWQGEKLESIVLFEWCSSMDKEVHS